MKVKSINVKKIFVSSFIVYVMFLMFFVFINMGYAKDSCECGEICPKCVARLANGKCCCYATSVKSSSKKSSSKKSSSKKSSISSKSSTTPKPSSSSTTPKPSSSSTTPKPSSSSSSSSSSVDDDDDDYEDEEDEEECDHYYTGGSCTKKSTCKYCGAEGSKKDHKYTKTCPKTHCDGKVCSSCGKHKGTCGGGCTYVTCSHGTCGKQYCSKCNDHTCPCNSSGSCTNPHCAGVTWCTICKTHTCNTCDTNAICSEPHCGRAMCSVCGAHTCIGGHEYVWTATGTGRNQTHIKKCKKDNGNCTATSGSSHGAVWGVGNTSHVSVCTVCNELKYNHSNEIVWSKVQRSGNTPHPCAWAGEGTCTATHPPAWGNYYKVEGGKNGDDDGGEHTRKCSTCNVTEIHHNISEGDFGAWKWFSTEKHERECSVCKLTQTLNHDFKKVAQKDIDSTNHTELDRHWKLCTTCDETRKEVDEPHEDNGKGVCIRCHQVLWKIINADGEDITTETINAIEGESDLRAKREEVIKIVEVIDGKTQYIQNITGPENLKADSYNRIRITKNGTYTFRTGRGGEATFSIDNISRDLYIEAILSTEDPTTGSVTITLRSSSTERNFNKEIYIKEGTSKVTDSELANEGDNPFIKTFEVTKNGTYYFSARDTAGNGSTDINGDGVIDLVIVKVVVNNIISGEATVAISNDVFVNGYTFTDILINTDKEGKISLADLTDSVTISVYKINKSTNRVEEKTVTSKNIKPVKLMNLQRQRIDSTDNSQYSLSSGAYYLQVAIGGQIFNEAGTYIIELENVKLKNSSLPNGEKVLTGINRIIVEVQDLKDLT